jgi:hypothetical protein
LCFAENVVKRSFRDATLCTKELKNLAQEKLTFQIFKFMFCLAICPKNKKSLINYFLYWEHFNSQGYKVRFNIIESAGDMNNEIFTT